MPPINNQFNGFQNYQTTTNFTGVAYITDDSVVNIYPVAPGQKILLVNPNTSTAYIKEVNVTGTLMPIRTFEYKERVEESPVQMKYVTKDDLETFKKELMSYNDDLKSMIERYISSNNSYKTYNPKKTPNKEE